MSESDFANPAVQTRKHEVVSCSVADPSPAHSKIRLPPRRRAFQGASPTAPTRSPEGWTAQEAETARNSVACQRVADLSGTSTTKASLIKNGSIQIRDPVQALTAGFFVARSRRDSRRCPLSPKEKAASDQDQSRGYVRSMSAPGTFADVPRQPDDVRSPGQSRHPAAKPRLLILTSLKADIWSEGASLTLLTSSALHKARSAKHVAQSASWTVSKRFPTKSAGAGLVAQTK